MLPGLIKGTPLSSMTGLHIQVNQECHDLRTRHMDGSPAYLSPLRALWQWEKEIIFLTSDCRTLKVTPNAVFLTGFGETLAKDIMVGDILKGTDNTFVVEKCDNFRVVSPIFNYVFPEPYWLIAKGVFVQCATKHAKEVQDECKSQSKQCSEPVQKELQQD